MDGLIKPRLPELTRKWIKKGAVSYDTGDFYFNGGDLAEIMAAGKGKLDCEMFNNHCCISCVKNALKSTKHYNLKSSLF